MLILIIVHNAHLIHPNCCPRSTFISLILLFTLLIHPFYSFFIYYYLPFPFNSYHFSLFFLRMYFVSRIMNFSVTFGNLLDGDYYTTLLTQKAIPHFNYRILNFRTASNLNLVIDIHPL